MRSARFPFREEPEKKEEHRGSRMHLEGGVREVIWETIDDLFRRAAERNFKPVTPEQAEAFREKGGRQ